MRLKFKKSLFLLLLLSFILNITENVMAESKPESGIAIEIGNDALGVYPTDKHLTNIVGIVFKSNQLSDSIKGAFDSYLSKYDDVMYEASVHQYMYTPENIDSAEVVKNDRPYAGWLFASGVIATRKGNSLVLYGVDMGVVGPSALGKETQDFWHDLIGKRHAKGWENQLSDEFGIDVYIKKGVSFRKEADKKFPFDREIIINGGVAAGNITTKAEVGATVRLGHNIPDDMGFGVGGKRKDDFAIYTVLKINEKYVVKDMFLDGNESKNGHSVKKIPFVTNGTASVVVRYKNVEFEYKYDILSNMFKEQDKPDRYGTFFLTYKKRF